MKIKHAILVSALLAASSVAMAQGSGGGGGGGPAGDNTAGAGGATGPAASREGGDAMASGTMASPKMKKHHVKKSVKKPMTDTTNTPGADASSDTKGQ